MRRRVSHVSHSSELQVAIGRKGINLTGSAIAQVGRIAVIASREELANRLFGA